MVPSLPLVSCESSMSVKKTLIEKKSEISETKHIPDLLFRCFSEDSCFETSSLVEHFFFSIFCSMLCRQRYLIFLKQRTLNEENGVKG